MHQKAVVIRWLFVLAFRNKIDELKGKNSYCGRINFGLPAFKTETATEFGGYMEGAIISAHQVILRHFNYPSHVV